MIHRPTPSSYIWSTVNLCPTSYPPLLTNRRHIQTTTTRSEATLSTLEPELPYSQKGITSFVRPISNSHSCSHDTTAIQKAVTQPDTGAAAGGAEYFVQTVADASACTSYLPRVCEWNRLDSASGAVASRLTTSVLNTAKGFVRASFLVLVKCRFFDVFFFRCVVEYHGCHADERCECPGVGVGECWSWHYKLEEGPFDIQYVSNASYSCLHRVLSQSVSWGVDEALPSTRTRSRLN